jgi:hemerythrin
MQKCCEWTLENEVFAPELDSEHREIFEVVKAFYRAWEAGAPLQEMKFHMDSVTDHLQEHFAYEEALMQGMEYPLSSWHKEQHNAVRRRLKLLVPIVECGDSDGTMFFLEFLTGWLKDHTSVIDRMLAASLRNFQRSHAAAARTLGTRGRSSHK